MTTYEQAVARILGSIQVLPLEKKALSKCLGQVAAEDVKSSITLPQRPMSGPDGYAVRAVDIAGATKDSPAILDIRESVRAGRLPKQKVQPRTATRIMTGSVVPDGADCIIRFEDTDEPEEKNGPNPCSPSKVKIYVSAAAGAGMFAAGQFVRKGQVVVTKGTVIGPGQISALTAIGKDNIKVFCRPVAAIICTGDELVSAGRPLRPGKVYNSNGPALVAQVAHHGGIARVLGIARDNQASVEKKIRQGMSADAILISGGVSKGDFDLVRLVVGKLGRIEFNRIQMGPGASFSFGVLTVSSAGRKRTVPVFALAGPPAGCLINFETLVRPALKKFLGYSAVQHPEVVAIAAEAVSTKAPFNFAKWTELKRTENGYQAFFHSEAGMGALSDLGVSNALTILEKGTRIEPGETLKVLPLDWVQ
jgi:molybdopterin molybdotransferase